MRVFIAGGGYGRLRETPGSATGYGAHVLRSPRPRRSVAALAAGLLLLSACGGDAAEDGASGATPAPVTSAPSAGTESADTAGTADTAEAGSETSPATDASSDTSAATNPATEGDADPVPVPEALQFSSALVGGGELDLATLAGRPVLLWFWAPF